MRRASTFLAVLGIAACALTGVASAAPTVTMKARAVPISGFPHTGNIFGAGAAVQAEFTITGTEYGGFPAPLVGVNFWLPTGAKIHSAGFKTCTEAVLKQSGPSKCAGGSAAGPVGHAKGVVAFGTTRVPEEVSIKSYFTSGGLLFYVEGHEPVQLEFVSSGKYTKLGGGGGFGPELITEVPLVETVPGAPDASTETINVKVGTAIKSHGKTIYYGTLPKKGQCPKGGFKVKAELIFASIPSLPVRAPGEAVTVTDRPPCPKK
ncbi:MAG: hypothetical protein QOI03_1820 [Solirubrobacteraceae bacterium]|jgi:hypothetical protein|nr:hypothetical protein [Solirubrobacteraceae bacterium]